MRGVCGGIVGEGTVCGQVSLRATNRFQTNNPLSLVPVYLPLGFMNYSVVYLKVLP